MLKYKKIVTTSNDCTTVLWKEAKWPRLPFYSLKYMKKAAKFDFFFYREKKKDGMQPVVVDIIDALLSYSE